MEEAINSDALIALAERCEAAIGPDRELDARIHCVREDLEFVMIGDGRTAYGSICDPSDMGYGTANTTTFGVLYARFPDHKNPPTLGGGKRANIVQGCSPERYTASLDAAMTLVPDGHHWQAGIGIETEYGLRDKAYAWCSEEDTGELSIAVTAALALTAAALRARAQEITNHV